MKWDKIKGKVNVLCLIRSERCYHERGARRFRLYQGNSFCVIHLSTARFLFRIYVTLGEVKALHNNCKEGSETRTEALQQHSMKITLDIEAQLFILLSTILNWTQTKRSTLVTAFTIAKFLVSSEALAAFSHRTSKILKFAFFAVAR